MANVNDAGYQGFEIGGFQFRRDEYFAYIHYPKGDHQMSVDAFLRALQRDVAWNFFYGLVNFDHLFGTFNHYGSVDVFMGRFNESYRATGLDYNETFEAEPLMKTFRAMLDDFTNEGFDPFAAPGETGTPFGQKRGNNHRAVTRQRVEAKRMVGVPGDTPKRTDANGYPVNRHFADVGQEEPEVQAEPGFEGEVAAFNLFAYLSRSDVTWNPSVSSVVKDSLMCPTSEEYVLPILHGNDRIEWFVQLSDQITWDVQDKNTGQPRARVTMKAGDVAAMPADIRHQGYSPKRSMLLVWENASGELPRLIAEGKAPNSPAGF